MIAFDRTGEKTGYITISNANHFRTKVISDSLFADYDKQGNLIGIEYIDYFSYNDLAPLISDCEHKKEIEEFFNNLNLII